MIAFRLIVVHKLICILSDWIKEFIVILLTPESSYKFKCHIVKLCDKSLQLDRICSQPRLQC